MGHGQQDRNYVTYSEFVEKDARIKKIDQEIGGGYDHSAIDKLDLPEEEKDIQKAQGKKALMADFDWRHPIHIYCSERPKIIQVGIENTIGRHIPGLESFYEEAKEPGGILHGYNPRRDKNAVCMPLYCRLHDEKETKLVGYFWTGLPCYDASAPGIGRRVRYLPIPRRLREFCEEHDDALLKMVLCAREIADEGEFTKQILSLIRSKTPGKRQHEAGNASRMPEDDGSARGVRHQDQRHEEQLALCSSW